MERTESLGTMKLGWSVPTDVPADLGPAVASYLYMNGRMINPQPFPIGASAPGAVYSHNVDGLSPTKCYRFRWRYVVGKTRQVSRLSKQLYVNDCSKFCKRTKGCTGDGAQLDAN